MSTVILLIQIILYVYLFKRNQILAETDENRDRVIISVIMN